MGFTDMANRLDSMLTEKQRLAMMADMMGNPDAENMNVLARTASIPAMPENYIQNSGTGAVTSLDEFAPNALMRQMQPALDYKSGPVEMGGMKGYRLAGDPFTVQMADGSRLSLGNDMEAGMKRDTQRAQMEAARLKNQEAAVDIQTKQMNLNDLRGADSVAPTAMQTAQAMGVPAAPQTAFNGMSRKGREDLQKREILQAEKRLAEQEADARGLGSIASDAARFKTLNERTDTGPVIGSDPVAWLRGLGNDDVQEMKGIQARLTPKMREPGSGATSDFDAKMFQSALFGLNKNKGANEAIANAMILKAKAEKDRVAFNSAYLQANNTLRGADSAWSKYATDNPIFDPTSQGMPRINPKRQEWSTYFSGQQQTPRGGASGSFDTEQSAHPADIQELLKRHGG